MELSDYKVALEWDIEYLYIYMLTIAGQTAEPNGLNFLGVIQSKKIATFFSKTSIFFFQKSKYYVFFKIKKFFPRATPGTSASI